MAEFYEAHLTAKSHELYQRIRAWAAGRVDVTLWGGWAVYELVKPPMNYRSRDVDVIFHTPEALDEFLRIADDFDLALDFDPLDRIAFLRFKDDVTRTIQVDIFTSYDAGYDAFDGKGQPYNKPYNPGNFMPELKVVLRDKVLTAPNRQGRDATGKQEKDLLDIHRLAFHNRAREPALKLLSVATLAQRRTAGAPERLARCIQNHPGFAQDYAEVQDWLQRVS